MGSQINNIHDRDFEEFKKQLILIRGVYTESTAKAWKHHDKEKRLGQLAMIESAIDCFETANKEFEEKIEELGLNQKAVVLGAALVIKQLIASESSTYIGSKMYVLLNTALKILNKNLLSDPNVYVEAEGQFFEFINNKHLQVPFCNFLKNKYGVNEPYSHVAAFGDQINFLRRLAENQNFIFLSPARKEMIGHYANSSADTISYIPYSLAMGAGFTAGRALGDQISENRVVKSGVTAGGMWIGYSILGVPGLALGVATHTFASRMLRNSLGFLFGGIIGKGVQKVSRGALYYVLYTQFGAMIILKDIATGACYYVTDKEKFNKFFKLPEKIQTELKDKPLVEQETLDKLFGKKGLSVQDTDAFKFKLDQDQPLQLDTGVDQSTLSKLFGSEQLPPYQSEEVQIKFDTPVPTTFRQPATPEVSERLPSQIDPQQAAGELDEMRHGCDLGLSEEESLEEAPQQFIEIDEPPQSLYKPEARYPFQDSSHQRPNLYDFFANSGQKVHQEALPLQSEAPNQSEDYQRRVKFYSMMLNRKPQYEVVYHDEDNKNSY